MPTPRASFGDRTIEAFVCALAPPSDALETVHAFILGIRFHNTAFYGSDD